MFLIGKKCPRCDSKKLKMVKPGFFRRNFIDPGLPAWTLGMMKPAKNLNVCRDCGFSWEDR